MCIHAKMCIFGSLRVGVCMCAELRLLNASIWPKSELYSRVGTGRTSVILSVKVEAFCFFGPKLVFWIEDGWSHSIQLGVLFSLPIVNADILCRNVLLTCWNANRKNSSQICSHTHPHTLSLSFSLSPLLSLPRQLAAM